MIKTITKTNVTLTVCGTQYQSVVFAACINSNAKLIVSTSSTVVFLPHVAHLRVIILFLPFRKVIGLCGGTGKLNSSGYRFDLAQPLDFR